MNKNSESNTNLNAGTLISLPCSVNDGAVSSEKFIECDVSGQNSGFVISGAVSTNFVDTLANEVIAVITQRPSKGFVPVYFSGEIFSSGNPVNIPVSYVWKKCKIIDRV